MEHGVGEDQIIELALDEIDNAKYRNPFELNQYVKMQLREKGKRYYVFIDEIQFVSEVPNPYVDDPEAKITFIFGIVEMRSKSIFLMEVVVMCAS